jgi:hypothetical protein
VTVVQVADVNILSCTGDPVHGNIIRVESTGI